MKILILGAGKMGTFFANELSNNNDVVIFDNNIECLNKIDNMKKIYSFNDIKDFNPDILINAVSLQFTIKVFEQVIPLISANCIIVDIASTKNSIKDFYEKNSLKYVSMHPMFGPTFADIKNLENESTIIISSSDLQGIDFFSSFYDKLKIKKFFCTFEEHDLMMSYSLTTPFCSTFVFASALKKIDAPGTTFKKHLEIAKGLLSEDPFLLEEIIFNKYSESQIDNIIIELNTIKKIVKEKNRDDFFKYINKLKNNIG